MPELTASAPVWSESEAAVLSANSRLHSFPVSLPVSVIVAVRNDVRNLRSCLESLRGAGEVCVIDSQSTDETIEVARSFGAKVVQFHYHGGWPKKRQWALDTLSLEYEWVLLLDADESLSPELVTEIRRAIADPNADGYYIGLDIFFLGKRLRHSGATFYKLCLFRRGKGQFECRTRLQDASMCDMEVHEHVVIDGPVRKLKARIVHRNIENLSRYIQKHNEYSNWEARVGKSHGESALQPKLFGSQAERRRWIRARFFNLPGSSILFFFYKYVLRFGFLDGVPGLIYCGFQAVQFFHIKAKLYEAKLFCQDVSLSQQLAVLKDSHVRH
ncbi:MAG TPA: glycosyltransferase family 2 protein [Terriglobales bacterium]|nr:glycosyltransferase family 2 protein [Terriglobales bacterium]